MFCFPVFDVYGLFASQSFCIDVYSFSEALSYLYVLCDEQVHLSLINDHIDYMLLVSYCYSGSSKHRRSPTAKTMSSAVGDRGWSWFGDDINRHTDMLPECQMRDFVKEHALYIYFQMRILKDLYKYCIVKQMRNCFFIDVEDGI